MKDRPRRIKSCAVVEEEVRTTVNEGTRQSVAGAAATSFLQTSRGQPASVVQSLLLQAVIFQAQNFEIAACVRQLGFQTLNLPVQSVYFFVHSKGRAGINRLSIYVT
jgi:hypothetical protein